MEGKEDAAKAGSGEVERIQRYSTNTKWEPIAGFARAVRAGNMIFISGTTAVGKNQEIVCPGDVYGQARRCFEIIKEAVTAMNAKMEQVVRTRLYVTDVTKWEEVGRAHKEYFGEHPPASTLVGVQLVNPDMLIEVEAEVYVGANT